MLCSRVPARAPTVACSRLICATRSVRFAHCSNSAAESNNIKVEESTSSEQSDSEAAQADPLHHASMARSSVSSTGAKKQNRVLVAINESTKWVVSAAAGTFLLLHHDAPVMWCLLGSIVSSFINKALKLIINEQRPRHARKADPGMPSSHASSLGFLAIYSAASLLLSRDATGHQLASSLLGAKAIVAASLFLTWLRVALGYHTTPQVAVGYTLGSATALGWLQLGRTYALPLLSQHPGYSQLLMAATYLAAAAFAARNLAPWIQGLLQLRLPPKTGLV